MIGGRSRVPCLALLGDKHASTSPYYPSPLRVRNSVLHLSPASPSISICIENLAVPSAPRDPKKPRFTPARKNHPRISHVSVFQNVGSAHTPPAKTPRNPTLDSPSPAREVPAFSRLHPLGFVVATRSSTPQKGVGIQNRRLSQSVCVNRATNPCLLKGACAMHAPDKIPDR